MIILNNNDNKSIFNLLLIFLPHNILSRALCDTVDLKCSSNGGTAILH